MTDPQTMPRTDERIERAAQALAHFEGSDVFDQMDTAEGDAGREAYRARVAALLARTVPLSERPAAQRRERISAAGPDPVLALSFNRQVTADVLADLTPDEITALFGALHTIASITRKPTGGTA